MRFRDREVVIAAACIVAVLLAGIASAVVRTTSSSTTAAPRPPKSTTSSSPSTTVPTTWDPRVLDIVQFVERRRGLKFKHPVPMEFLDDATFDKKVTTSGSPSVGQQNEMNDTLGTLRAVGLAEGSPDLQAADNKLASNAILGLYSPHDKGVLVRGSNLTVDVRVVLAHELTHALQDQYFGLDRLANDTGSGEDTGFRALVEADAVRVEDSYVDSLPSADAKAFEATRAKQAKDADVPDVPEALVDDLAFPYVFGPAFVAYLDEHGGNDAINAAFKKPPQSEAQIVDPQSYVAGVTVTKVSAPALNPGQKLVDKAHDVGQVSMLEVLGSRLPFDPAWAALKQWTGDQGLTYRENGKVCFAGDTALKDSASADTFENAAKAWAATMPAASVARVTPTVVDLRSCDPGPGYKHAVPQPSAFKSLGLRSQLIADLQQQAKLRYAVATCTADALIARLGAAQLLALDNVTDQNDPRIRQVQQVTREVLPGCLHSTTT
ncbi:MAG: hypothetical protein JO176_14520 [Acidimicrobiia bacterium]|nr:hypothetical protein [Acidimicrobiia bacterium]